MGKGVVDSSDPPPPFDADWVSVDDVGTVAVGWTEPFRAAPLSLRSTLSHSLNSTYGLSQLKTTPQKGSALISSRRALRSSATLRLMLFFSTFTAEARMTAEIRREDFHSRASLPGSSGR